MMLIVLTLCFLSIASFAQPCASNTAARQLDFWLGNWNIVTPGAPGNSTSNVHLALDKCLIVEDWNNGQGHSGVNMFGYSPEDKSWHGMFANNDGHVHVFPDGKVSAGSAEFHGPSRGPNGETVMNRIRITRVAADKVRQIWEKSTDNGANWRTVFEGDYSRAQKSADGSSQ